jgi:fused signal recognition particle receptor
MFQFLKQAFSKIKSVVSSPLQALFGKNRLSDEDVLELKKILLSADAGIAQTNYLMGALEEHVRKNGSVSGTEAHEILSSLIIERLNKRSFVGLHRVVLFVGINGSGKTTSVAKIAAMLQKQGKRVLIAAADTFRAAAVEQLSVWGDRLTIPVVVGQQNADPASVVYAACERMVAEHFDYLLIDTAGRLQTKIHLMKELEKIHKIIQKKLPAKDITTLLTVDAMLGQNSFDQAKVFAESTPLSGIILTKMDGTGKGGIVLAINEQLGIPVAYITAGEGVDALIPFNAQEYTQQLIG